MLMTVALQQRFVVSTHVALRCTIDTATNTTAAVLQDVEIVLQDVVPQGNVLGQMSCALCVVRVVVNSVEAVSPQIGAAASCITCITQRGKCSH
jgi:hypothetical protein